MERHARRGRQARCLRGLCILTLQPGKHGSRRGFPNGRKAMENLIAKLVQDFEQGKMSRRQLIQSLSIAAAAAAVPTTVIGAQAPTPTGKLEAGYVNHISYSVSDYAKCRDFYPDL